MIRQVIETARRVKRLRQRAGLFGRPHALGLMYHRIALPAADPWDLSVSPQHFGEHLSVVRRWAACRSFGDLAAALDVPARPHRMAAITFDDGYRDNVEAALPLLQAHDVPATVFVVSGTIGAPREFWWDALTRVFLATQDLPERLEIETQAGPRVWKLAAAARCSASEMRRLASARFPFDKGLHPRMRVLAEVRETLFQTSKREAEGLADAVLDWAGLDRSGAHGDQPMTEAELCRLSASGLVEVGAHTVTHRPLDTLSDAEALSELAGSRATLRNVVGREIATFAYPYGSFGPDTPRLVAEAGFKAACTTVEDVAVNRIDPCRFPRIVVRDWDGDAFARVLRDFAGP